MKKLLGGLLILLVVFYFLGPEPKSPNYQASLPAVSNDIIYLADSIAQAESKLALRPDNEARIIWHGEPQKREWCILYLHGFSASQGEGAPLHQQLAQEMGANLLLSRWSGHGFLQNQLATFTAEQAWLDALHFLAIANKLGKKVLLVSTSTGGTLALKLAAQFPDQVDALINLSPNIRINDPAAFLLNDPWGKQIATAVIGPIRRVKVTHPDYPTYWDTAYTVNALVELEELVESSMQSETFAQVKQASLTLYYYKSEEEQDPVVRVDKILWMQENLGGDADWQLAQALPCVGNHVLASPIKSLDPQATAQAALEFVHRLKSRP